MEGSHFYFDTPDITKIPFDRYPQVKDVKGIYSIEENGQQYSYISTQRNYFNNEGKNLKISVIQNPEYVIVVDYSVGCGKLYKVKFKDLQAYFSKNSDIDFNNKIFSHYGDVSCIGKTNDDTEGSVVDYSGKISKEELQKIIKSLNVTSGETGIKGKIFITNASDEQKIEKVKSILKDLEQSSKKEIYLCANYVGENQFTIDFAVGGGVENRDIYYLGSHKLHSKNKKGASDIEVKGEVGLTLGGSYKKNGELIIGAYGSGKVNVTGGGKIE